MILASVSSSTAVDLNVLLEILDKNSNTLISPVSVQYYWRSFDNLSRTLNLLLTFEINGQQLASSALITQAASVSFLLNSSRILSHFIK
jgi:hypothetical protein